MASCPKKNYPPPKGSYYKNYNRYPPYYGQYYGAKYPGPYQDVSYEPAKVVVEKTSCFTFWTFVLYLIIFFAGFLVGYFAFAFRRSPAEQAYYNKYPSALLGDSDVF